MLSGLSDLLRYPLILGLIKDDGVYFHKNLIILFENEKGKHIHPLPLHFSSHTQTNYSFIDPLSI